MSDKELLFVWFAFMLAWPLVFGIAYLLGMDR